MVALGAAVAACSLPRLPALGDAAPVDAPVNPQCPGSGACLLLVAGSLGGPGYADGTGAAARLNEPHSVGLDSAGNLYVADAQNHVIRKVTPTGVVTTFAGTVGLAGSADGTGSAAQFDTPSGVAVDANGTIYVADSGNNAVRAITSAGVVTTFAGTAGLSGSANGTGSAARFNIPVAIAVDSTAGLIYVADTGNSTIRKITTAAVVTTLAGSAGVNGSANGTGAAASFYGPEGITVDSTGIIYVADSNNDTVRKVTAAGVVTTLAGSPGASGSLDATGTAARFDFPTGLGVDGSGNVYVADTDNSTIRKVSASGVVTTLAGDPGVSASSDGTGSAATFGAPTGLTVDTAGNVYIADAASCNVRVLAASGMVTTLAGVADVLGVNNGSGAAARFHSPNGVAIDGSGNIYVADTLNDVIRKITAGGEVTTLAGSPGLDATVDGTGAMARFSTPVDVVVDGAGYLYVSDAYAIRKITPAGMVTTLAGAAGLHGSADGQGPDATFDFPTGIALDAAGNVYVADSYNDTIRKVTADGMVSTLAGSAQLAGSADGTGSAARFSFPQAIAVDSAGTVYVGDTGGDTIRAITPGGMVTTLAGRFGVADSADGTGSAATFSAPIGLALDSAGNLYVADRGNDLVRAVTPQGAVTTIAGAARVSVTVLGESPQIAFPTSLAVSGSAIVLTSDEAILSLQRALP